MLGLGLALSIGKRVLGDAIDSLLSALKGRATYYENGSASKSTIKAIDNADVLDKATILLTPTATSDARVHSVKTYTGDELVTNGTYDTDLSGWTNTSTHWQWSSGSAYHPLTTSFLPLKQTITNNVGAVLRITFDLTYVQGTAQCFYKNEANSDVATTFTSSGSYTIITEPVKANTEINFGRALGHNTEFYIDNISIVDVSSDFDFDRASSATRINSDGLVQDMQSITDPELVLNGDFEELGDELVTNGDFSNWTGDNPDNYLVLNEDANNYVTESNGQLRMVSDNSATIAIRPQPTTMLTVGKIYKVSVDLTFTTGTLNISGVDFNTSGTKVFYLTAGSTYLQLAKGSALDVLIDNVSVQQVDPNDRWSLGAKWTIANGVARLVSSDSSSSGFIQSSVFTIGNTYNITFDATVVSGEAKLESAGGGTLIEIDETKTYNHTFVADRTDLYFNRITSVSDISLDNISVKDITFSTDVDLARINYDSNGENGHILLEPTSTNLVTYSEDFDDTTSDWTNTNISVETNSTISPQGINNAAKITEDTSNSEHQIQFVFSQTINTNYSYSVFVKANGRDYFGMNIGASRLYANFDLTDGSVTNVQSNGTDFNNESASITSFGNGWYKCTLSGYALTINGSYVRFTLRNVESSDSFLNYLGDGTSGVYIWGAQLEALSYATSYIPTLTGSTVTRATETLTGSGNSTLINSTEGVLYAEIENTTGTESTYKMISITDSSTTNKITLFVYQNKISAESSGSGTNLGIYEKALQSGFNKIAVKYKSNDCALWVNGIEYTDTSFAAFSSNTLNTLVFDRGDGLFDFYGKVKALAVFNEALSDTELTNLTS